MFCGVGYPALFFRLRRLYVDSDSDCCASRRVADFYSMRRVYFNLCALAVGLLFGGLTTFAYAAAPVDTWMAGGARYYSQSAACESQASSFGTGTVFKSATYPNKCTYTLGSATGSEHNWYGLSLQKWCTAPSPGGSAPIAGAPLAEQCPTPPPEPEPAKDCSPFKDKIQKATFRGYRVTGPDSSPKRLIDDGLPSSVNGCNASVEAVTECYTNKALSDAGVERNVLCTYEMKFDGTPVPPSDPRYNKDSQWASESGSVKDQENYDGSGDKSDGSCPRGTIRIGTDSAGTPMCRGEGTAAASNSSAPTKTTKPVTTTTNPDGSTVKTEVTEQTNGDGSKTTTTKTTTTNPDGSVTTSENTVTGTKSDGGDGTKDEGKDEKKDDLCKLHPELNICKNSSISGACDATACQGDAISCAIAKATREKVCKDKEDADALKAMTAYTLGNQLLTGEDPLSSTLPKPKNATVVPIGSLNANSFLGGGECLPDKSISVHGQSFVIPFSQLCPYLIPLRLLIMVVAAFVSLRIVSGSVFRS